MHTIRGLFQAITIVALAGVLSVTAAPVHAAGSTFVVNTNVNTAADGLCSLEEAIKAGNQLAGGEDCGLLGSTTEPDIIHFNLPVGQRTITLTIQQAVSGPLLIDGTSQPGYAGTPLVHITGTLSYMFSFSSSGGGSTIKGIKFSSTKAAVDCGYGNALYFSSSSNNVVVGNYFHTNGTSSLGTCGRGVWIIGTSNNNTIGGSTAAARNYFGGMAGVSIDSGTANTIQGNYFGVNKAGNARLIGLPDINTTTTTGIQIGDSSASVDATIIRGNVIGGYQTGIYLLAGTFPSSNTHVVGNKIGVGADGVSAISNGRGIKLVGTTDNTIGGTALADRNIISANADANISLINHADRNLIKGNFIGTDASGLHALLPASSDGITISDSDDTAIGGSEAGSGNVISGNGNGINICCAAVSTSILGNKIGTDKLGAAAIPNMNGIIASGVSVNIGDTVTPGNNLISGNGNPNAYGIYLLNTTTGSTIYGNKIGLISEGGTLLRNGTAISLEYGASATISGNWIGYSAYDGVYVGSGSSVPNASQQNCFTGNTRYGVYNLGASPAPFTFNWWGHATGPEHSGNLGGAGDAASDDVDYSSFLTSRAPACAVLVANGSFETDANHDNKPDQWIYSHFSAVTDRRDCTVRRTNSCSLLLAGNGTQKIATQTLLRTGGVGDDLVFILWSRASAVPAGATYQIQMQVYNGATLLATRTANFSRGTHAFQKITARYTAPGAYDRIVIKVIFTAASGTAWFDTAYAGWAP